MNEYWSFPADEATANLISAGASAEENGRDQEAKRNAPARQAEEARIMRNRQDAERVQQLYLQPAQQIVGGWLDKALNAVKACAVVAFAVILLVAFVLMMAMQR